MTKHLLVFVAEKDGYDPIHTANCTGDFKQVTCLVRRSLGYGSGTADLAPEKVIEGFFESNMRISELAAMTEAAREIGETLETEADEALERLNLIRRSLVRRLEKIRERHRPHSSEAS